MRGNSERNTTMIFYVIPVLIWSSFCIWKALYSSRNFHFADYGFALPLIALSALRGEVGNDTPYYIANAQATIWWNGQRSNDVEIGYELIVRAVAICTNNPRLVVAVISLLAAILFFLMLYMWENGQHIVTLILVPFCYFFFTMNTLRVGIAFPLAAIAILQLEKKRYPQFYVLAFAAICVQMTAALLLPMLWMARGGARASLKGALWGMTGGAAILYLAYYLFADRIAFKVFSYSLEASPDSVAGIGHLLMAFVCSIVAIWFCEGRLRYLGLIFLVIQVALFEIAQSFPIAGRAIEMGLFAQFLALSYSAKRPISRRQIAVVCLLCGLTFTTMVRNIAITAGEESSFIPYHFIWESR